MKFKEICIKENLNKKFEDEKGLIWTVVNIDNYGLTLIDDNKGLITNKYSILYIIKIDFKECKNSFIKKGQYYYFINSNFNIGDYYFNENRFDILQLECVNMYPYTSENKIEVYNKVELIADKRKLQSKMEQFARDNNEYEIDWNDDNEPKYYLFIEHNSNEIGIDFNYSLERMNTIYFTSYKIAEKAKEEFGKEILRLYLPKGDYNGK